MFCSLRNHLLVSAISAIAFSGCASDEPPADADATCDAALPTLSSPALTTDGSRILDALGREVLLRGVNTGGQSKLAPFIPFDAGLSVPLDPESNDFKAALDAYADRVVAWGHNVVRVPVTWHAVEPERDQFDAQFMTTYRALLQAFADRGVRVIVDFHQDVYAQPFCGDGFPLWTIIEPVNQDAERDCHQWFQGYLTDDEVKTAYDHFWADTDGLQGEFEDFWRHLAEQTKDIDHVVAFEIFNEPGWGSAEPKAWAKDTLTPFYSRMIEVIRQVAPDALLLFDSTGTDAVAATTALERPEGNGLIFAPHYYDALAITSGVWLGQSESLDEPIGKWRTQGDEWDVPVLLGEFGIKAQAQDGAAYVRLNWDALDTHLMHGTQWEYSVSERDWNSEGMSLVSPAGVEQPTAAEAIRAYPAAVAGRIQSFDFDRETMKGTLRYQATSGGISEIVVPTRLYPNGVDVAVVDAAGNTGGCAVVHAGRQRIAVRADAAGELTVTFSATGD